MKYAQALTFSCTDLFDSNLFILQGRGLTRCQRMHQEALSSPEKDIHVPQCNLDGRFEEVQCHGLSDECWCVDHQGTEITGTRRKGPLKCAGLGLCNVCLWSC